MVPKIWFALITVFMCLSLAACATDLPAPPTSVPSTVTPLPSQPVRESPTPEPTASATAEPTAESQASQTFICSSEPVHTVELRPISWQSRLRFVDEETIEVMAWAWMDKPIDRPEMAATLALTDTKRRSWAPGWSRVDVTAGGAVPIEPPSFDPLRSPCGEECYFEVFSESPDSAWQLVLEPTKHISLVSRERTILLTDFIPYSSEWQWSDDNSLLWFVHSEREFGWGLVVVDLIEGSAIVPEYDSPLDPTWNQIAFSPEDKTVLSVEGLTVGPLPPSSEVLRTLDLSSSFGTPVATDTIPGIIKVLWDDTISSHLVFVMTDGELEIRVQDPPVTLKLPLANRDDDVGDFINAQYTVSPSFNRFAFLDSFGTLEIFDCALESGDSPRD